MNQPTMMLVRSDALENAKALLAQGVHPHATFNDVATVIAHLQAAKQLKAPAPVEEPKEEAAE